MDQSEHQNQKSLTQYLTPQFLKKVTQLILSFSLFSFVFSYSSWYSIFLHTFKFYFSSLPFKLLTHTLDKKYPFLICNAILVFLANASGLLYSQSGFDPNEHSDENNVLQTKPLTKQAFLDNEVFLEKEKEEGSNLIVEDEEQEESSWFVNKGEVREEEKESLGFMIKDEEQEETSGVVNTQEETTTCVVENEELESGFGFEGEEEEENEEDEIGRLSKEELNKKFEDFIRKMKEGIRIEARGQLIMV